MNKLITFKIGLYVQEKMSKHIESKEDAVLLILYTIRQIFSADYINEEKCAVAKVCVSKMNRIFYFLDNKMFSLQFPFLIKVNGDNLFCICDYITKVNIDDKILSVLISFFEMTNEFCGTFEDFFNIYHDVLSEFDSDLQNDIWRIVFYLYRFDIGYIRYDYDEEYQNGDIHPLSHFDIFLDDMAKFKIGLKHNIDTDFFIDVLDTITECVYIDH